MDSRTKQKAWRAMAAFLLLALVVAGPVAAATPPRPYSLKQSPGYVPLVDPESSSVRIGRRLNAPLVSRPFVAGARSLDDLGCAATRMLNHDRADSLIGLCITEAEFREILWREFPQSRPATHLEWLDGWKALYIRHRGGVTGAIRDRADQYYEYVRIESRDTPAIYRNFKLHNSIVLVVRVGGREQELRWIRSVAERKGRFKIYSTTD